MHLSITSTSKACIAVIALVLAFAVPVAAGLACVLGRSARAAKPEWVAVATVKWLPADGVPQRFPVVVRQFDAWMRLPDEVAGTVFLGRVNGAAEVRGLRTTYHAGCSVEYDGRTGVLFVPCWEDIRFDIDGRRLHSIPEWGDLQSVRTAVRGDVVYVNLSEAIPE